MKTVDFHPVNFLNTSFYVIHFKNLASLNANVLDRWNGFQISNILRQTCSSILKRGGIC